MKRTVLGICDPEERYLKRLLEALGSHRELPFEIRGFTQVQQVQQFAAKRPVWALLVAESVYRPEMREWVEGSLLLLSESGSSPDQTVPSISKYQPADRLLQEILALAVKDDRILEPVLSKRSLHIIGVYTPVGRCLQTTFSIVLGQLLAKKHKVLYLNFESFSGLGKLLHCKSETDITALVYSLSNTKEKFVYQLGSMTEELNGMAYLPPACSYPDITMVDGAEWQELLKEIENSGIYEYLVLDLSDCVQGLFDILRLCGQVYTITKEDGIAQAKLEQYESILRYSDYEDVLDKTEKCRLPVFNRLPVSLEQATLSEIGAYVKDMLLREGLL